MLDPFPRLGGHSGSPAREPAGSAPASQNSTRSMPMWSSPAGSASAAARRCGPSRKGAPDPMGLRRRAGGLIVVLAPAGAAARHRRSQGRLLLATPGRRVPPSGATLVTSEQEVDEVPHALPIGAAKDVEAPVQRAARVETSALVREPPGLDPPERLESSTKAMPVASEARRRSAGVGRARDGREGSRSAATYPGSRPIAALRARIERPERQESRIGAGTGRRRWHSSLRARFNQVVAGSVRLT